MRFSTQTERANALFGVLDGTKLLLDAGYTALDITLFGQNSYIFAEDYKETAKKMKALTDERGVIWNQSHAPFGGGYDHYTTVLVPQMPRVFEFAGLLGVKNVVVHPLQKGRYYGRAAELMEMNMEFYSKLAPYAKDAGVKIAIENMWQRHPKTGAICDDVCADPHELNLYYDTLNDPDAFTICLDIGHVAICGREPENCIEIIGGKRLGALHVHDVDYLNDLHTLPGISKVNFDPVCKALADIDYQGEITLEADNFLNAFTKEQYPVACKLMAMKAKQLADRVEEYKAGN